MLRYSKITVLGRINFCIWNNIDFLKLELLLFFFLGFAQYHQFILWSANRLPNLRVSLDHFLCGYQSSSDWNHWRTLELFCDKNHAHQMLAEVSYLLFNTGFLVLGNTQKILTEIWHQIWDKTDGENIWNWNYFWISQALSELPANCPSQFSQTG